MQETKVEWKERDRWGQWQKKSETFKDQSTATSFKDKVLVPTRNHDSTYVKDIKMSREK